MVGGTFFQSLVEGSRQSRVGEIGFIPAIPQADRTYRFFNTMTLEGVCGAHAVVVLTGLVNLIGPLCLPRVVKKEQILFATGLRRLEAPSRSCRRSQDGRFQPSKHQPRQRGNW
jgi:hypothetical protein